MARRSLREILETSIESDEAAIPVFDEAAQRVLAMLQDLEFDMTELERIVVDDPALTSGVLRGANSSFYGGLEKIVSVKQALTRLGSRNTAKLVFAVTQREQYRLRSPQLLRFGEVLWRHASGVAVGSEWLAGRLRMGSERNEAMLAGLLHDCGKLFVLHALDQIKQRQASFDPSDELVLEAMRQMHCWAGARLLEAWNLPESYRRVVEHHHDETLSEDDLLLGIVRMADRAARRIGVALEPDPTLALAASDEGQLLGLDELDLAELEVVVEDALGIG